MYHIKIDKTHDDVQIPISFSDIEYMKNTLDDLENEELSFRKYLPMSMV
ncbi:hypothetical protein J2750_001878 [Methanococcoides alaskense]|uniref:Uncharacterized protein n=1 Tax=Methanococcoides alaskense TaxID=325778 RepID=A0AA90U076_9EURY|nr:hypothetical protein [Methanococcoides alaskense]